MKINRLLASVITIVLAITMTGVIASQIKNVSQRNISIEINDIVYLRDSDEIFRTEENDNAPAYYNEDLEYFFHEDAIFTITFNDITITENDINYIHTDNIEFTVSNATYNLIFIKKDKELNMNLGDNFTVEISASFEVNEQQTGILYTLLSLLPLIFAGAVVTYIYTRKDFS